jgi:toxin-antitoxin system PIN domain toxin
MAVALLDLNVLMALAWPTHVHHDAAHRWFSVHRHHGWASCPHTQLGFLRLSLQPAVVKTVIGFNDALESLRRIVAVPEHEFWSLERPFAGVADEILERISGHHQLADAMLLDLAIRHSGRLVTFDRRIAGLLPAGSEVHASLEILTV